MRPRRALAWTALWAGAALAAFAALRAGRGAEVSNQFLTGYLVELSLSVDNVLVFAVIFEHFAVEPARQGRLLLWGVLGSALLRSAFLFAGAAALHRFHWLLDLFGVLLIAMALRMAHCGLAGRPAGSGPVPGLGLINRLGGPVERLGGRFLLVLLVVEATDLVFALDSLPAVLAVAPNPAIALASNLFAVMGLRSLYFAVVAVRRRLRLIDAGLAAILRLIGARILAARWVEIPTWASLSFVGAVLAAVVADSLLRPVRTPPGP